MSEDYSPGSLVPKAQQTWDLLPLLLSHLGASSRQTPPISCPNTWSCHPYLWHRVNFPHIESSKLSVLQNRKLLNFSRANSRPQCSRHPEGNRDSSHSDSSRDRTCKGSRGILLWGTAQSLRETIFGHLDWTDTSQEILKSCCRWKGCLEVYQSLLVMSKQGLSLLLGAWINRCWMFHTSPYYLGDILPQKRCPTYNRRSPSTLNYRNLTRSFRFKLHF